MTAELPAALVEALRSASRSGEIAVAYSGGLDSRFLAFAAKKSGLTPLLYHVTGPHVAPAESESALSHAREMGFPVTVVPFDPSVLDLAKAGRARWCDRRPSVRGIAMNPVDHPHGGRTNGGRQPVSPWGWKTKGKKTRNNKRTDALIIRSRHDVKKA